MPFRFRKTVKLGKGLRLNLSKGGASLSTSRGGKTVSLGKHGVRGTTRIAKGVSYSKAGCVLPALVAILVVIVSCGGAATNPTQPASLATTAPPRTETPLTTTTPRPTTAPTLAPTPAPTAAPTVAPLPSHSVQLTVTSPVRRGSTARADATTTGSSSCTITVTYASGPSSAQGLTPKTANSSGAVSWSWTVGGNTTVGTWPVDVACTSPSGQRAAARATFVVQ